MLAVMPDCGGVGKRCGFDSVPAPTTMSPPVPVPMLLVSASITQSALPAICALVASKSTLFGVTRCASAAEWTMAMVTSAVARFAVARRAIET